MAKEEFKIDLSQSQDWNPETSFPNGKDDWEDKFDLELENQAPPKTDEAAPKTDEAAPKTDEAAPKTDEAPSGLGDADLLPRVDALQKALQDAKADGKIDPQEVLGLLGEMMGMVQLLVRSTPPAEGSENTEERKMANLRSRRVMADKGGWEPVPTNRDRLRKKKPGGGYTYKDAPKGDKGAPNKQEENKDKKAPAKGEPQSDKAQDIAQKSNPAVVERFHQELPNYKLDLVARSDGELDEADIENVKDIQGKLKWMAERLEKGIKESADICEMKPPVCEGNMGITRNHMPQIMDSTTKELLNSMEEQEYDDIAKQVEEAGGDVKAAIPDKGKREAFVNRRKGLAAVEAGADPEDDRPILKQLMADVQKEGIKISDVDENGEPIKIPVGQLKATQSEIKAGKTYGIANAFLNGSLPEKVMGNPIIATSDGHILDGHHRYSAALTVDPNYKMNVTVIDMPMRDFLMRSHQQPGVFRADIDDNIIPANQKVDLATPPDSNPQDIKKITRKGPADSAPAKEPQQDPDKIWGKEEWAEYKKMYPGTNIVPKFAMVYRVARHYAMVNRVAQHYRCYQEK